MLLLPEYSTSYTSNSCGVCPKEYETTHTKEARPRREGAHVFGSQDVFHRECCAAQRQRRFPTMKPDLEIDMKQYGTQAIQTGRGKSASVGYVLE